MFCRYLVREFYKRKKKTALLDTDPGQSIAGPPATVGMLLLGNLDDLSKVEKETPFETGFQAIHLSITFVGSITPMGHLLQLIVGAKKLLEKAIQLGAERIVINTSGLVRGDTGRELKFQKIDLLGPSHIIALQRGNELESILKNYSKRRSVSITRLQVSDAVRVKGVRERNEYRKNYFRRYFKNAKIVSLPLDSIGFHGKIPDFTKRDTWLNLLIGLCDQENYLLAIGILKQIEFHNNKMACLTLLKDKKQVCTVQFGSIKISE